MIRPFPITMPDVMPAAHDPAAILERSRSIFAAQWQELLRLRRAVLKSADPDDIHDLRVASRRFRAVLELFYPFAQKGGKVKLRKKIRNLTRMLGALRNLDEALLFFKAHVRDNVSSKSRLVKALSRLRPEELKLTVKTLENFDQRTFGRVVRKMIAGINEASIMKRGGATLPACFSEASLELYRPIQRLLAVCTAPEQRESRHTLRIAIKKMRYFYEIVATVLDRDYTPFLELLKEYQSLLGRMNDIAVFETMIGNLKLPPDERAHAEKVLLAEDRRLLEEFTELIERKPLAYIFIA